MFARIVTMSLKPGSSSGSPRRMSTLSSRCFALTKDFLT